MIEIALAMTVALGVCALCAVTAHEVARHARIRIRFAARGGVAAIALAVAGSAFFANGRAGWTHAAAICVLCACAVCAVTDAQAGYVFDAITYPSLAAALACSMLAGTFEAALLGVLCAGGPLLALYAISRGRGLGLGDVKLAACIGAAFGATSAAIAIGAAFVLGGAWGAWLLLSRRASRGTPIRFAPYIFAGMLLALLHGRLL
ncbi:MAG TPA: A24 family peptidase [Candidatus Baltobacteraceae bacterium]|jgi:leader peptidase (prepilin peptidase)/N-methyltransferase